MRRRSWSGWAVVGLACALAVIATVAASPATASAGSLARSMPWQGVHGVLVETACVDEGVAVEALDCTGLEVVVARVFEGRNGRGYVYESIGVPPVHEALVRGLTPGDHVEIKTSRGRLRDALVEDIVDHGDPPIAWRHLVIRALVTYHQQTQCPHLEETPK